ncbi:hypothetical protein EOD39_17653 [Acipenser ruthenus]|uniref:Uncharacterized protein n=1 Tax=Acipenser ruthenus TaxID=7906 RepID=A0A444V2W0_ACIRT|nr:hypothetical protein EOD39_17653 [Acipenser ruthenus]
MTESGAWRSATHAEDQCVISVDSDSEDGAAEEASRWGRSGAEHRALNIHGAKHVKEEVTSPRAQWRQQLQDQNKGACINNSTYDGATQPSDGPSARERTSTHAALHASPGDLSPSLGPQLPGTGPSSSKPPSVPKMTVPAPTLPAPTPGLMEDPTVATVTAVWRQNCNYHQKELTPCLTVLPAHSTRGIPHHAYLCYWLTPPEGAYSRLTCVTGSFHQREPINCLPVFPAHSTRGSPHSILPVFQLTPPEGAKQLLTCVPGLLHAEKTFFIACLCSRTQTFCRQSLWPLVIVK